jgi:hypothetical protein
VIESKRNRSCEGGLSFIRKSEVGDQLGHVLGEAKPVPEGSSRNKATNHGARPVRTFSV